MDLVVEQYDRTLELVNKFETCNEKGDYKFKRLIILDGYRDKFYYMHAKFGFIIEREKPTYKDTFALSKLKEMAICHPIILKYWNKRDELATVNGFDVMLHEKDYIHIKAQGEKDRSGFYKYFDSFGNLVESKNFGDCSFYYRIIGFRFTKREQNL